LTLLHIYLHLFLPYDIDITLFIDIYYAHYFLYIIIFTFSAIITAYWWWPSFAPTYWLYFSFIIIWYHFITPPMYAIISTFDAAFILDAISLYFHYCFHIFISLFRGWLRFSPPIRWLSLFSLIDYYISIIISSLRRLRYLSLFLHYKAWFYALRFTDADGLLRHLLAFITQLMPYCYYIMLSCRYASIIWYVLYYLLTRHLSFTSLFLLTVIFLLIDIFFISLSLYFHGRHYLLFLSLFFFYFASSSSRFICHLSSLDCSPPDFTYAFSRYFAERQRVVWQFTALVAFIDYVIIRFHYVITLHFIDYISSSFIITSLHFYYITLRLFHYIIIWSFFFIIIVYWCYCCIFIFHCCGVLLWHWHAILITYFIFVCIFWYFHYFIYWYHSFHIDWFISFIFCLFSFDFITLISLSLISAAGLLHAAHSRLS